MDLKTEELKTGHGKMTMNKIISNKIIFFILFLIAFVVIFSSTYNPFNFRRMHVDSAAYITVTQGIIRGQLPYKDFVDNKGPLTYLISVPGFYLGGFTGIWITELLLMFISVLFSYKIALFFSEQRKALFGTILSFITLIIFFTVNAGTEEYSLPFLTISLYIFTKYYFSNKNEIGFVYLIILGICFISSVLIRINMFPLWAGFCSIILIELIIKRRFILIFKYILGFLLGILFILLPVFLYLFLNDILNEFIRQVIVAGASRGFSDNFKEVIKNYYIVISRGNSSLPLFIGLFLLITKYKTNEFFYYIGYVFSYILTLLFLSFSSGGSHYNIVLIPFFVPAIIVLVNILDNAFCEIKYKDIILIFFTCFLFSEGILKYINDFSKMLYEKSGINMVYAGKIIDENTKPGDKILSLENSYIYPFTKRDPVSKYFYQGSGISAIANSTEDFYNDVFTKKPVIIAILTANEHYYDRYGYFQPIFDLIDKEYHLLSNDYGYNLFIRVDRNNK